MDLPLASVRARRLSRRRQLDSARATSRRLAGNCYVVLDAEMPPLQGGPGGPVSGSFRGQEKTVPTGCTRWRAGSPQGPVPHSDSRAWTGLLTRAGALPHSCLNAGLV